jgi:hypothetical protein
LIQLVFVMIEGFYDDLRFCAVHYQRIFPLEWGCRARKIGGCRAAGVSGGTDTDKLDKFRRYRGFNRRPCARGDGMEQKLRTWQRRRERPNTFTFKNASFFVSIHAPAQGATKAELKSKPTKKFQSTLPRRERPGVEAIQEAFDQFQSTLPRREQRAPPIHR